MGNRLPDSFFSFRRKSGKRALSQCHLTPGIYRSQIDYSPENEADEEVVCESRSTSNKDKTSNQNEDLNRRDADTATNVARHGTAQRYCEIRVLVKICTLVFPISPESPVRILPHSVGALFRPDREK